MNTTRHSIGRRWRTGGLALAAAACSLAAAGCMGSWTLRGTRLHYNESFSHTSSQELLLNIVRMRYGETPTFLDLPTINNATEAAVIGTGAQPEATPLQGVFDGDFLLRDEPTLSYQPRRGGNLAESLTKPLKAEMMLDIPPGNDSRTFLLAFIDSINGLRNSPTATSLVSRALQPNDDFRHAVDLFMGLQNRGVLKLRVATRDEETQSPVTDAEVMGADAVVAAKAGYIYQTSDEQVTLLKRSKLLVMAIKPEELGTADLTGLTDLFQLVPGRTNYVIRSQEDVEIDLNVDSAAAEPPSGPREELAMNVRSGYQVLAFLSKSVDVPASHVRRGSVQMFQTLDCRPFDARQLTSGLFRVHVQKHKPLRSDLAVHYRHHWFYIPEDDVQSRATLSLVKFIIDVNSQSGSAGPILTLPLR